jgi:hypothetical protein
MVRGPGIPPHLPDDIVEGRHAIDHALRLRGIAAEHTTLTHPSRTWAIGTPRPRATALVKVA